MKERNSLFLFLFTEIITAHRCSITNCWLFIANPSGCLGSSPHKNKVSCYTWGKLVIFALISRWQKSELFHQNHHVGTNFWHGSKIKERHPFLICTKDRSFFCPILIFSVIFGLLLKTELKFSQRLPILNYSEDEWCHVSKSSFFQVSFPNSITVMNTF